MKREAVSDYNNILGAREPSPLCPLRPSALLGASRESSSRLSNLIVINARGQDIHARSKFDTFLR